ncbi:hypothetical protein [Pseudonocardia sp.]|uniref:hypothetical protein n=1 Tax=Pseudonocardia sp. TaxID=60912 RepID=UPI003D09BD25
MRTHRWAISSDPTGDRVLCEGSATSNAEAWLAALSAGRIALLDGTVTDLAVTVDDWLPTALYSPARDAAGRVDPDEVTADLVTIYQCRTADATAAAIERPPPRGRG